MRHKVLLIVKIAEIVMLLISHGAKSNVKNKAGWTQFLQAEASEETKLVEYWVKAVAK